MRITQVFSDTGSTSFLRLSISPSCWLFSLNIECSKIWHLTTPACTHIHALVCTLTHFSFSSVQFSRSVVSDSLRPHESQHARPPCPSPTPGVYSNSCPSSRCTSLYLILKSVYPYGSAQFHNRMLGACMHAKSLQSCPTLCDPMDSSPPGSSVHRILQARILEYVAISFSIWPGR